MNDSMLYFVVDTRLLQKLWPVPWTWMARNLATFYVWAMLAAWKTKGTTLVKLDIHWKPKDRVSLPLIRLMKPPIYSSPMAQNWAMLIAMSPWVPWHFEAISREQKKNIIKILVPENLDQKIFQEK
jgi:hypothetical protein